MLGVRSIHEPVTGKYAEQLAKDIFLMYTNPQKVDKSQIRHTCDWSRINDVVCSLEDL